jgi:hypothetical protein
VPFERNLVEAKLALDRIGPEELPALAWDALEAGFDGHAIRRMAAFVNPTGWQTDQILPAFMRESGLQRISIEAACVRIAIDLARRLLTNGSDPLLYSRDFELLWIKSDYSRVLQDAGSLDDQKYVGPMVGETEAELREHGREVLIALSQVDEANEPP